MKSDYKPLGNYIKQIKKKNTDGSVSVLKGIRINKEFMESVANIQGTDLSKYRVVEKNQFAYNPMHVGRDEILPISVLLEDEPIIVSPAYVVFKILDHNILNPEYLMMWCRRTEFDRNVWFTTDSSVRGGFSWESLCELELPIPCLEEQNEIVKEYNTIVNRIRLNETLNQKLEDTAQALYKHWFVDFEFPNADGKRYKSSGGEMVYNEELDIEIPLSWESGCLGNLIETINGFAFKSLDFSTKGTYPILKIKNVQPPSVSKEDTQFYDDELTERLERVLIEKEDILITMTGSGANQINSAVGQVGRYYFNSPSLLNQRVCKILVNACEAKEFVYLLLSNEETHMELLAGSSGSANQANISPDQIKNIKIVLPNEKVLLDFEHKVSLLFNSKRVEQQIYLHKLKDLILSKMSKVEVKGEMLIL